MFCQKNDAPPSPLVPTSAVPLQPLTGDAAATLAGKDPGDGISLIQPDPGEGVGDRSNLTECQEQHKQGDGQRVPAARGACPAAG